MEEDTSHDEAPPVFDERGLSAGTDVGGYVIDDEIGRGGMGVVYSATHPVIGKRAAIKVLKPSLSKNPATVERFTQEARSVNQIGHPGIVDIFAFGSLPDGRYYLVMDLLEGESLRKRLKRGPLHPSEAVRVIDEIASALIAAHGKGFIHRDLKPDNVFLVMHPGRIDIKLLDFGLAKLQTGSPLGARAYRTATGAQLGTPDYMSPEQLRASVDLDERTDIYSLGVLAFESLVGKRPRRLSDGSFDMDGSPAQLVGAVASVPPELAQLVDQMLAPHPDGRPSLAHIRGVMKKLRPSLPSVSVLDLQVLPPPLARAPVLESLTASTVGARPLVPTPHAGTPRVAALPPAAVRIATTKKSSPPPMAGLRTSGTHAATTLGVPPPPAPPPPPRITAPRTVAAPRRESRPWLVIGAVLVVVAAVALVLVLAA
ncbi:MAG: serine/threonine-protein kinase [Acidobacteriota bacterium]